MPKHIMDPRLPRRLDDRTKIEAMGNTELTAALNTQRSRVRILTNHIHNLETTARAARRELEQDEEVIRALKAEKGERHGGRYGLGRASTTLQDAT